MGKRGVAAGETAGSGKTVLPGKASLSIKHACDLFMKIYLILILEKVLIFFCASYNDCKTYINFTDETTNYYCVYPEN